MTESFHPPEGTPLEVKELDGSPDVSDVSQIKVTNGTLTDDGSGVITLLNGGGAPTRVITTGASCSGSDGDANRVLTLSNTELTTLILVYVNGTALIEGVGKDYKVNHLASNSTVEFLKNLFDAQDITILYYI